MRVLYSAALYLAMPAVLARLGWRGLGNPGYWQHLGERFGYVRGVPKMGRRVWFHAVSVGEVHAAIPIILALTGARPELEVWLTTMTPTGRERARQVLGDRAVITFVPYDVPGAVARFVRRATPDLLVIMETEIWPNLIAACERWQIPVVLANARLSERSQAGYRRLSSLARETLNRLSVCTAQTQADGARLVELGLPAQRLMVTGSVKFDVAIPASVRERGQALRRLWGTDRGVLIAASTHEGEEALVLRAFARVLDTYPSTLLVWVPRHPERFGRVAALARRQGFKTVLHSQAPRDCAHAQVYVGDTMGDLTTFYAGSDLAFVGGSFVDIGGHNVLEPAALGVPVLTGPNVRNFADIIARLCCEQAAAIVTSGDALVAAVLHWLADANARHQAGQKGSGFVQRNRGALARVQQVLEAQLGGGETRCAAHE
ncbi:MAG: 3-deoxy-D-manno-octulosonic acid transferase [Gammaproteobacteria bacterium]|nr:3-deoxy-D-manno-octulosonic acid transferase [Gammaproteobacteria bacterium]